MMTDLVVAHQALIREAVNGCAAVLCLTLTAMISIFIWDSFVNWWYRHHKESKAWAAVPGIQTACALWWVFAAETYRTGAVWTLYQIDRTGDASVFFNSGAYWSTYGYLFAGIVLNVGLLRAIYIFTPPEWKNRVWVYASVAAALFVASPTILSSIKEFMTDGL